MENVGSFPKLLQHVHQIQNQRDVQLEFDSDLEGAFAVGQGHAR
jgi:hypothetical protein